MFGVVLTHAYGFHELFRYKRKWSLDGITVVTSWGLQWNTITRAQVLANFQTLVRTTQGDPSNKTPFLHPELVIAELAPWYELKPDAICIIGNEPNTHLLTQKDMYDYRYYLNLTITAIRSNYPYAKIVSPAASLQLPSDLFYTICGTEISRCDYLGLHVYGEQAFTDQLQQARVLKDRFRMPVSITECGLRNVKEGSRVAAYDKLQKTLDARHLTYYHYCAARDIHPEYHVE